MELYDQILNADDAKKMASTHKYVLKQQQKMLNRTMMAMWMTLQYGDTLYQKELSLLEEKIDKIDACLALTKHISK